MLIILVIQHNFGVQGLAINPSDAWSTHTMCHVMEMMGRQDEGIIFLDKTVSDWEVHDNIANCINSEERLSLTRRYMLI